MKPLRPCHLTLSENTIDMLMKNGEISFVTSKYQAIHTQEIILRYNRQKIITDKAIKNIKHAIKWIEEHFPHLIPSGVDLYSDIGFKSNWKEWMSKNPSIDMPYPYIIQMIGEWIAVGVGSGNYMEVFDWYDSHKEDVVRNATQHTVKIIGDILSEIEEELSSED